MNLRPDRRASGPTRPVFPHTRTATLCTSDTRPHRRSRAPSSPKRRARTVPGRTGHPVLKRFHPSAGSLSGAGRAEAGLEVRAAEDPLTRTSTPRGQPAFRRGFTDDHNRHIQVYRGIADPHEGESEKASGSIRDYVNCCEPRPRPRWRRLRDTTPAASRLRGGFPRHSVRPWHPNDADPEMRMNVYRSG